MDSSWASKAKISSQHTPPGVWANIPSMVSDAPSFAYNLNRNVKMPKNYNFYRRSSDFEEILYGSDLNSSSKKESAIFQSRRANYQLSDSRTQLISNEVNNFKKESNEENFKICPSVKPYKELESSSNCDSTLGHQRSPQIQKEQEKNNPRLTNSSEVAVNVTQRAFDFLSEYGED